MAERSSKGRHGGNHGPADKGDDQNPTSRVNRNTDVESVANNRNDDRAGGRKAGAG